MPPIQLLLTRRLLLAKQLLTETVAAGDRDRVRQRLLEPAPLQRRVQPRYGMPPTRLRKKATEGAPTVADSATSTLQLVVSPALRLDGRAGVSRGARADRRRVT